MPSCGCPDVKLDSGDVRPCSCQPCSAGNLDACSCNKGTGCGCASSAVPAEAANHCVCAAAGKTCSCSDCGCKTGAATSGSCCS
ncbi:hypothetical protein MJO28_000080 [Puccinia striiformis f. sp. tritici]|uniref:Uncharacterized protein n=4 Tax=Puccinia striiformis TaxID=27350 RepID=A0A0L0V1K2_9BASI|nr:hypothetical protein Pst134EA_001122 [Puccinia striiformis f. sp. tritici]KNE92889.1 hypothetical protein PSTG_13738 [Puccinia striiformis f. sp. tritici PST-78]POV94173.1 hypothetical protein PSHT_16383 [Puccinia striiformis]KAH9467356.1 hypothetical protein Pst134EB_002374 [Puccinia striiformis f. sp. tritici]KAH9474071.1 hypothetical protein Pst134EA_001122 [Puccinia striiformis f. sp. tritici]KAI7961986.1 hypothetical protein MJO28_000080 [Puccinia striiformis f. sp. tritici]